LSAESLCNGQCVSAALRVRLDSFRDDVDAAILTRGSRVGCQSS
jgi:hypothetical protein